MNVSIGSPQVFRRDEMIGVPSGFAAIAVMLFCVSCSPLFAPLEGTSSGPIVTRLPGTGEFTFTAELGDVARDVVLVFSASANPTGSVVPYVEAPEVKGVALPFPGMPDQPAYFENPTGLSQSISNFNRDPFGAATGTKRLAKTIAMTTPQVPNLDTVNDTIDFTDTALLDTAATCRYVSTSPITVAVDATPRILNVWVADDCWDGAGIKAFDVNQTMVDWLAGKFLADGADNDIYDWLTAIIGPEWGGGPYSNLIGFDGNITILITDIENDNSPDGGIVGYFWALNNFLNTYLGGTSYAGMSNQRIIFVLDAVMLANPVAGSSNTVWEPEDYWAKELYSTLAHEFQHMISFYKRSVVNGNDYGADVWIEELCAQLAEDLLSERMGVPGPRGVASGDGTAGAAGNTEGRIPFFNKYSYLPLVSETGFDIYDYSTTYTFGAWLARNYGGAGLLSRMLGSSASDSAIVQEAAGAGGAYPSDLDSLIARWAIAVMGSDNEYMPPGYRLNTGGFFDSSINGASYRLGSIDMFRYNIDGRAGPWFMESVGPLTQARASSNVYYLVERAAKGSVSVKVKIPEGVIVHAVIK